MTPHPHPQSRRAHMPTRTRRRSVAMIAAVLVVGGTPFVARAIGDETPVDVARATPSLAERAAPPFAPIPDLGAELDAPRAPRPVPTATPTVTPTATPTSVVEPTVDPVIFVLTDTYTWDERSERVAALQEALGINADGWYSNSTQRAHRMALAFVGLSSDTVPTAPLPPGPDPSAWAALRDCESNGNYAITNPSGKYRGAYQFDRSTWNSVAERHAPQLVGIDPAAAAPADQDAMALALYSERGARPWPHCGRYLT